MTISSSWKTEGRSGGSPRMSSQHRRLPTGMQRALGACLAALAPSYVALCFAAYWHLTPPSALFPNLPEMERLLFSPAKPVSQIQRLLESAEGEMDSGGTMRPAFTEQSVGWDELTSHSSSEQTAKRMAARDAECEALLSWARNGASREAYEQDRHYVTGEIASRITPTYAWHEGAANGRTTAKAVRIRTLINDRCVTCHGENGRHDTARFISLETYDAIAPHLRVEDVDAAKRWWLLMALGGLFPLAGLTGLVFWLNGRPLSVRSTRSPLTREPASDA